MKRILCLRIENPAAPPIDALQSVAARCKQFTPLVGIDPDVFPQSVLLDITNVVHLFGGEAALVQRIIGELRAEGWQLHAAVAGTPGAAWALARYEGKAEGGRWKVEEGSGQEQTFSSMSTMSAGLHPSTPNSHSLPPSPFPLPPSTFHPPLSSLPLEALRLSEPIVALLHGLGIWRIGQLEALSRRELSSRFGPELLDCLDRVTGRLSEPLPAWDPPQHFEVRWSAEFPTARQETISAALEHLVRRLAAMLTQAGRGAMRLECLLYFARTEMSDCCGENSSYVPAPGIKRPAVGPLQVAVGLFRPSAWANHLVELLQVRFEALQLSGPIDSIRLTAPSTAPLELRQQEMFSAGPTRAGPHHLSGLIDRLSNRLGHTCVMRVRLIPEAQPELACYYTPLVLGRAGIKGAGRSCATGPRAGSPARPSHKMDSILSLQPRPLRLLTHPVRLSGGIDGQFHFAGQQQGIVRRWGPERIETGWWRGRTVTRDYYRIETATGRCYWVYQRRPAGPWFLHGMFD